MRLYHHLVYSERRVIQKMRYGGNSVAAIANRLERDPSTIYRDMNRNKTRAYEAQEANEKAFERLHRRKRKLDQNGILRLLVVTCLLEWWSPEQISEFLTVYFSDDPMMKISHESLYQWIYEQMHKGKKFCKCLRRNREKRQKRDGLYKKRFIIEGKKSIHDRPEAAVLRTEIGHWEADLIQSKGADSYLVTLVDRAIQYMTIAKISQKDSESTVHGFSEAFGDIQNSYIKSITVDNGSEFAKFKSLEELFECEVFFADPYCAWQRGINENTNGLIRQYLPKSISFKNLTEEEIENIKCSLNNRPRKKLHFRTPEELYLEKVIALET